MAGMEAGRWSIPLPHTWRVPQESLLPPSAPQQLQWRALAGGDVGGALAPNTGRRVAGADAGERVAGGGGPYGGGLRPCLV